MISFIAAFGFLFPDSQPEKRPPPLRAEQIAKVRDLVRKISARDATLKKQLAERQRSLRDAYADFQLDERRVRRLRKAILDTQTQLLNNYHELQVDLRKIVGKERFVFLKRRIDNALQSKKKPGRAKRTPPTKPSKRK